MASFTVQELVDRAKVYVDDDHSAMKSWIADAKWLAIFNAEYAQLYKKWVRNGLMQPVIQTAYLSAEETSITGVLAIVGVARDENGSITMLSPAQPTVGRDAFWRSANDGTAPSCRWAAFGIGDTALIQLDPAPSDLDYVAPVTGVKATLDLGAALTAAGTASETVLSATSTGTWANSMGITLGALNDPAYVNYIADYGAVTPVGTDTIALAWPLGTAAFTNQQFEAAIIADWNTDDGPIAALVEVSTASTSTTNWQSNATAISNLADSTHPILFSGGVDEVAESSNYIARYVPTPTALTALSGSVEVPYGADERLVLGIARRAHLKDSGASRLLEQLIVEADTELGFSSMGKVNGPKVMRSSRNPFSTPTPGTWPQRFSWRFL